MTNVNKYKGNRDSKMVNELKESLREIRDCLHSGAIPTPPTLFWASRALSLCIAGMWSSQRLGQALIHVLAVLQSQKRHHGNGHLATQRVVQKMQALRNARDMRSGYVSMIHCDWSYFGSGALSGVEAMKVLATLDHVMEAVDTLCSSQALKKCVPLDIKLSTFARLLVKTSRLDWMLEARLRYLWRNKNWSSMVPEMPEGQGNAGALVGVVRAWMQETYPKRTS